MDGSGWEIEGCAANWSDGERRRSSLAGKDGRVWVDVEGMDIRERCRAMSLWCGVALAALWAVSCMARVWVGWPPKSALLDLYGGTLSYEVSPEIWFGPTTGPRPAMSWGMSVLPARPQFWALEWSGGHFGRSEVALWIPAAAGLYGARLLRRGPRAGMCGRCGYDLSGNRSGRCPECGTALAAVVLGVEPAAAGDARMM